MNDGKREHQFFDLSTRVHRAMLGQKLVVFVEATWPVRLKRETHSLKNVHSRHTKFFS